MTDQIVPTDAPPTSGFILSFAGICFSIGAAFGFAAAATVISFDTFGSRSESFDPFTPFQLENSILVQTTWPAEIKLRIVDKSEIERLRPNAYAFSYTYAAADHACEIFIPDKMPIRFWPAQSRAEWVDKFDGDTLAHEILHCLRGSWHPQ